MSPQVKNYLLLVLFAATASSSLIAWKQTQRIATLRESLIKVSAPANTAPKAAPAAATSTTPATPAKAAPVEVEVAAPAEEVAGQQRQRGNRSNIATLMADPHFTKMVNLQQRGALDSRYAALFKQLNLPPAELEKFKDLLVERQTARMDVMNAARENGLNPRDNRDEIRNLAEEAQAEVDATIKATLGEDRYAQYQNYNATQPHRGIVSQLEQRLSYSSTPITSAQSEFLVKAIAANSAPASEQPHGMAGGGNRAAISDAVIQQAQSVLAPDQLAALKELQIEQQAQEQVREMMRNNTPRK